MRRPPLCSSTYYNLTALCQCSTSATHTHKRTNPETVLLAASKPLCISSRSSSSLEHITCSCKHLAHALLFSPGGRTSLESALPPGPLFCVFSDFMLKATQTQECFISHSVGCTWLGLYCCSTRWEVTGTPPPRRRE